MPPANLSRDEVLGLATIAEARKENTRQLLDRNNLKWGSTRRRRSSAYCRHLSIRVVPPTACRKAVKISPHLPTMLRHKGAGQEDSSRPTIPRHPLYAQSRTWLRPVMMPADG